MQALKTKLTNDAEWLQWENAKQMQEQKRRLQNLAAANLEKDYEYSEQMDQMRETLRQKERKLQRHNAQIEAEYQRVQREVRQLRRQQEDARRRYGKIRNAVLTG